MSKEALQHIADQITKAERKGWFDVVNYSNATSCMDLLKEIREYASDHDEQTDLHEQSK